MSGEVVTWGGDAMPEGVSITPAEPAEPMRLSERGARVLTDRIRGNLERAARGLVRAYYGRAHEALGYGEGPAGWHAYGEAEFGDLRLLRLPLDERLELERAMTGEGWTRREVARAVGVSAATVSNDLLGRPETRRDEVAGPDAARGDDAEATSTVIEALDPFRGLSPIDEVLARVAAQGDRGLTSLELDAELDRPLGTATASLSRLDRRRLVVIGTADERRLNRRPYRVTEAGLARLVEVIAARDAAEVDAAAH